MIYTPNRPDWYYSYVDLPNLEKIKQELLFVRDNINVGAQYQPFYVNYFKNDIVQYIPTVCDYLKAVGLYNKFYRIIFSAKKTLNDKLQSHIHVDTLAKSFIYSLNIPLIECEDTYTAWYNGKVEVFDQTKNSFLKTNQGSINHFGVVDESNATEICRVETVKPMLINTTIPHRALTTCPGRVLACIRFVPDLTESEFTRLTSYST